MDDDKSEALYRKMYFGLFRAVTEALEAMAQQNFGAAADRLRRGQRDAEEIFIARDGMGGE